MIKLIPISTSEFTPLIQHAIKEFAEEGVQAGRWTKAAAYAHAKILIEGDLPKGLDTQGHWFFNLLVTETQQKVGYLWLEIMFKDNLPTLYISDIEIEPPHRRKGYAVSAFTAIEQFANSQNIKRICLHVFRQNVAAQALYKKLGFHVTGLNMLKNLSE